MDNEIQEIKNYAISKSVPIMKDDGIDFLIDFIKKHNISSVLELGTAIGYSSIIMALSKEDVKIVTIERDEERYNKAVENIKLSNLENRITTIFKDALEVEDLPCEFDLIFIDAAKGQNIKFFEKYTPYLKKGGYVITDNIYFHGFVEHPEIIKNRNLKQLVRKISKYIDYLNNNDEYETEILKIGDGISISKKK